MFQDEEKTLEEEEEEPPTEQLDPAKVREARMKEMKTFEDMLVYEYASMDEALCEPHAVIIDATWVDQIKGGAHKSRLCAREFAKGGAEMDDLFAGTPPLLATKLLVSECATRCAEGQACRLMALDVKMAFLYGRARRPVFIRLPREDPMSTNPQ